MNIELRHIEYMEEFFKNNPPPNIPMKIAKAETVTDPIKMVKSHIPIIKENYKKKMFKPYYDRLVIVGKITKQYYKKKNNG